MAVVTEMSTTMTRGSNAEINIKMYKRVTSSAMKCHAISLIHE